MMRNKRPKYRGFTLACAVLAFFAHLLIASRLTELLPGLEPLRLLALGCVLVASFVGVCLCIDTKKIFIAITSVLMLVAIPLAVYNFDSRTGGSFSVVAGGNYYGIGLLGLFVALSRHDRGMEDFIRIAFWISIAYIIIYILASQLVISGKITPPIENNLVIQEDASSGRSARITLASSHVAFVLGVLSASLLRKFKISNALLFSLCLVALWLAQSRVFTLVMFSGLISYVFFRKIRVIGFVSFFAFCLATFASIVIAFSPINPFDSFIYTDVSGATRRQSIEIVHRLIDNIWIVGAGIAHGTDGYKPMTGVFWFYPSDIGMIGQLFNFGIFGVLLYVIQAYGACFSDKALAQLRVDQKLSAGLQLAGVILTAYSVMAPVFSGGSGTVFGVLFLALIPYAPVFGFWRNRRGPIRNRI